MGLRQDRDAPALEPLDPPHLPERPAPVELGRVEIADQRAELAQPARRRHRDAVQVIRHIEVLVVDHVRAVEPERHLAQARREARRERQALGALLREALEAEILAHGLEHHHRADVRVGGLGLERQEDGIAAGKLAHGASLSDPLRWGRTSILSSRAPRFNKFFAPPAIVGSGARTGGAAPTEDPRCNSSPASTTPSC
jgi:hypothetical protein